jgi:hypothetical protein
VYISTTVHGVIFLKTVVFIVTDLIARNVAYVEGVKEGCAVENVWALEKRCSRRDTTM